MKGSDKSLWQTYYIPAPPACTPSSGSSDDQAFPRHASDSGPAVAIHRGKLYCVHKGNGDRDLW
ncbi:hypothetical protein [Streptomyces sp. NPDC004728]|uniref:hypothetical protein n=1 Tax=Streptomyces sp. NPDC004728 TaxID=3154289 RepID=UPI0033B74695